VLAVPVNRSQPRHQTIVSSGEIARKRCHCRPPGFSGSSTPSKIAALNEKRGRYEAMLAQLDRTGEDQISLTDPDSRAMAAHTKAGVGYNIQVAVDAKHKLIVEQAVTNQVVDMGLLTQTALLQTAGSGPL
jgi:hypothetical protein